MTHPTPLDRLRGLAATLTVLGITVGLPTLLMAIGASPIPSAAPSLDGLRDSLLSPDDGTLVLTVLAVVVWAAWAFMALSLVLELGARIRGVRAPRLPGLAVPQAAARGLITAAALLFIAAPLLAAAPTATASANTHPLTSVDHTLSAEPTTQPEQTPRDNYTAPPGDNARPKAEVPTHRYTVKAGESLWSIATAHLGSGERFNEIADLNRDVVGDKPGFLLPGWVLKIPAANTVASEYTVKAGDTLSTIARDTLGDTDRYMEIFHASTGRTQVDGDTITDPNLIRVGWTLNLPATTTSPRPTQDGNHGRGDRHHVDHESHKQPAADPTEPVRPDPPKRDDETDRTTEQVGPRGDTSDETVTSAADKAAVENSVLGAPWMLAGLTGGGVLLSGALFLALQARRRSQFRARRPGRMIAAPDPDLAAVEKSIAVTGTGAAATVEFTDRALRGLSIAVGAQEGSMPALAAVELGHGALTLHLSAPHELPDPWQGTPDRTHWHLSTANDLGPEPGDVEPPYPLLLTIGTGDTGETWMLNCEELACLTISGDQQGCRDLLRHLAAQLAVNPWSTRVGVDCVGVAEEAASMDSRISHHPSGQAGNAAVTKLLAAAVSTIDRATRHDVDVATGRTGRVDDDVWPARLLLLDAAVGDPEDLDQLLRLIDDHASRAATAVIIAGEPSGQPGLALQVTGAGRVVLDHVGLDLLSVGLTREEARGCAQLYAQRDTLDDTEIPIDNEADEGWQAYADQTGGLRPEHTLPRNSQDAAVDETDSSLLQDDDDEYLVASAAIAEDLQSVAPRVSATVRIAVEAADPHLDRDVADWFNPDCSRPQLSLLGPVHARTRGKALAKRRPYFTELLAYLALRRRHGSTRDEICDAFGISAGKARDYTNIVRDWLGPNLNTGEPHLPNADKSPAAQERGINLYQVDQGLLIDTDLFQRLNLRAKSRGGHEGHQDLHAALQLVTGRPFDQLRTGGWSWLHEGERHDEYALVAVADVAFTLVTHYLADGDVAQARSAAEIAMLAAPHEEVTRLCLVRISEAAGDTAEAERILRDEICNRTDTDNAPTELSDRSDTIIRNHQWLAS